LVGESGGGKSTALDIVTGLLRPNAGRVRLDDVDLFDVDLESWRRRVGFVMQDAPLFFGTILENIAWGDTDPDRGRVQEAAELAHLGAVVEALPDGLDTPVGPRGGRLSGGQRQRVALARALYQQPWLLVLDEATSALDSDSEREIREALHSLKGSLSMLIVAHRLRSVELAEHILVLANGEVIEEGDWASLSQRSGGVFQRMLLAQGVI
jgi:ABC-type multidrug transport system fused ATPase/permease subunit